VAAALGLFCGAPMRMPVRCCPVRYLLPCGVCVTLIFCHAVALVTGWICDLQRMDRQLTLHPPLLGGLDQIGRKELLIDKIFYLDISNTSYCIVCIFIVLHQPHF